MNSLFRAQFLAPMTLVTPERLPVRKIVEVVGCSPTSWEEAARNAVESAAQGLRDLRVAEVAKLDMKVEGGKVVAYRARISISFRDEG